MINWIKHPRLAEVAKYIECYWFIDKPSATDMHNHPKLNPDPACHLIIASPEESYHYQSDTEIYQGKGSYWLYPHSKTFELDHTVPVSCIGIKFKVGALYSLNALGFDKAMLDSVTGFDLKEISVEFDADSLLESASKPDECCTILDQALQLWLANKLEDQHSEMTRRVLPLLVDKPINKLGELLFCSQRTLERSFLRVTGLTLKQCQSMNKLETILEYLYQREEVDIDWVDIAYQFNFSDQPHLIRYLKKQIGLTPKNYVSERGFTIDIYGGVEMQ